MEEFITVSMTLITFEYVDLLGADGQFTTTNSVVPTTAGSLYQDWYVVSPKSYDFK